MMSCEAFNAQLQREFDGRLRCRATRDEYHIEQKVGRAVDPPAKIHSWDDDAIRARDGYVHVMTIKMGDRMKCPDCGFVIKLPVNLAKEAVCDYCRSRGNDGRWAAYCFHLGDALISHLRKMDPMLGWNQDLHRKADALNQSILDARTKAAIDTAEAVTLDDFRQLVGIPMTGYTGKEFKG